MKLLSFEFLFSLKGRILPGPFPFRGQCWQSILGRQKGSLQACEHVVEPVVQRQNKCIDGGIGTFVPIEAE